MSTNMELITSVTVGSGGAASVTLPATGTIAATYTDLLVTYSIRGDNGDSFRGMRLSVNGSTANLSVKQIQGLGSGSLSSFTATNDIGAGNTAGSTSSTFTSGQIYFPDYASSNNKAFSGETASENNASLAIAQMYAGLWNSTSAITSIGIAFDVGNIIQGSTFYLYGISAVTSTPKATGGMVSQDNSFWYHTFASSGIFTPTTAISADCLIIAGGGGGGSSGGGGGAGGLIYLTSQSLTTTAYAVTVGAGGAGGGRGGSRGGSGVGTVGTAGGNSVFNSNTANGGGAGASEVGAGSTGGSGGGGTMSNDTFRIGYTGTAGQGNSGGNGDLAALTNSGAGGGGGAGGVGGNGVGSTGGTGGVAVSTYLSFANATFTGVNGFYAGGGGGGVRGSGAFGFGGGGGAGNGANAALFADSATINTGSGGGGGGHLNGGGNQGAGGAGGSGVVIVRYAK
jgi:hypothetical protein